MRTMKTKKEKNKSFQLVSEITAPSSGEIKEETQ